MIHYLHSNLIFKINFMYKKLLPTLIFALGSLAAVAQIPTLTSTSNPVIGDWHLQYVTDSFLVGAAGAAVTWNFSTLTIHSTDTGFYLACSASPSCATFPGTTLYFHQSGTPYALYYNATPTKISIDGEYATGAVPYTNYEDLLHYPFTYTSTFVDSLAATFVSSGDTFHRKGTITVTADGYGTLILPNGTYTHALRIHRNEVYSDSTVISGIPFGNNYITQIYTWYTPATRIIVSLFSGLLFLLLSAPLPGICLWIMMKSGSLCFASRYYNPGLPI